MENSFQQQPVSQSNQPPMTAQPVSSRGLALFDIIAILVIGAAFGGMLIPVAHGAKIPVPSSVLYALPLVMPIAALFCLWVMAILGRKRPTLFQLGKYAAIGFFNTALDFGVINFLVGATDITAGIRLGFLNAISFTIAVINSYLWNKYWTFKTKGVSRAGEFAQFVIVSLVGLILNSGFVSVMTAYIEPLGDLTPQQWVNAVKAMAIFISLAWNFAGYKFIVFREKK